MIVRSMARHAASAAVSHIAPGHRPIRTEVSSERRLPRYLRPMHAIRLPIRFDRPGHTLAAWSLYAVEPGLLTLTSRSLEPEVELQGSYLAATSLCLLVAELRGLPDLPLSGDLRTLVIGRPGSATLAILEDHLGSFADLLDAPVEVRRKEDAAVLLDRFWPPPTRRRPPPDRRPGD